MTLKNVLNNEEKPWESISMLLSHGFSVTDMSI